MTSVWVRANLMVVFDDEAEVGTVDRLYVRCARNDDYRSIYGALDYAAIGDRRLERREREWLIGILNGVSPIVNRYHRSRQTLEDRSVTSPQGWAVHWDSLGGADDDEEEP